MIEQFKKRLTIKREDIEQGKNTINNVISIIAFIYDMNFKPSFEILKKENYINRILDRFNVKDEKTKIELGEIRKISNKYIEQKIQ